jgi:hypothetical protein
MRFKYAVVASSLFTPLLLYLLSSLGGCSPCADITKAAASSSDNEYIVTYVERNCGATTDYSNLVTIERQAMLLAPKETVFIVEGQPHLSIGWNNVRELRIRCIKCGAGRTRIFKQESSWKDVKVVYDLN